MYDDPMLKRFLISGCMALAASISFQIQSHAQIVVNGNGEARACFQRALTDKQGRKNSIRHCETALRQENLNQKDRAATYVNQGILLMRSKAHAEALASYDKALKMKPKLVEAHINRGACLLYLGRTDEAITVLTTAIETQNDHLPDALYNRALAYERLGQSKAAYLDFKKALELRPDWGPATRALTNYTVTRRSSN